MKHILINVAVRHSCGSLFSRYPKALFCHIYDHIHSIFILRPLRTREQQHKNVIVEIQIINKLVKVGVSINVILSRQHRRVIAIHILSFLHIMLRKKPAKLFQRLIDNSLEQVIFIFKEEIQRTGRHACVSAYFSQRSLHITIFRELGHCTFQQLFPCFKFVTHYCTPLSASHNTVILAYNARYVNTFTIFSAYYMILKHNSVM